MGATQKIAMNAERSRSIYLVSLLLIGTSIRSRIFLMFVGGLRQPLAVAVHLECCFFASMEAKAHWCPVPVPRHVISPLSPSLLPAPAQRPNIAARCAAGQHPLAMGYRFVMDGKVSG